MREPPTAIVPVGFEFDGTHLFVGGFDPARTRKFRNVQTGNAQVAIVIDDLASTRPWSPRYVRIYGHATPDMPRDAADHMGRMFA